ncbi:hypothetical protein [Phascolarctobacterium sp.]|uniref:hypothetical protein n=1 Tax=Phascolarctobacterium sp. TaxID=2049039 RepID=UPI0038673D3F
MKFEVNNINYFAGCLQLPIPPNTLEQVQKLHELTTKGKMLTVEIKAKTRKRSLSANSYCWVLCSEIAKAVHSTKEEVYRQAIRSVGHFTTVRIAFSAIEAFTKMWEKKGIGWVVEDMGASPTAIGCAELAVYEGSSEYDVQQMTALIEYLIDEAQTQGIDVMSEADKALLLEDWSKKT